MDCSEGFWMVLYYYYYYHHYCKFAKKIATISIHLRGVYFLCNLFAGVSLIEDEIEACVHIWTVSASAYCIFTFLNRFIAYTRCLYIIIISLFVQQSIISEMHIIHSGLHSTAEMYMGPNFLTQRDPTQPNPWMNEPDPHIYISTLLQSIFSITEYVCEEPGCTPVFKQVTELLLSKSRTAETMIVVVQRMGISHHLNIVAAAAAAAGEAGARRL